MCNNLLGFFIFGKKPGGCSDNTHYGVISDYCYMVFCSRFTNVTVSAVALLMNIFDDGDNVQL